MLKAMWGETEDLMLSFWGALSVGGRVVRWQGRKMAKWKGRSGELGKVEG